MKIDIIRKNYFIWILAFAVFWGVCLGCAAESFAATPKASGAAVSSGGGATIDYSNVSEGYVMAKCDGSGKFKVQIKGPAETYTYDILGSDWNTYPLSDGKGSYSVGAFKNVSGNQYAAATSASFSASMGDIEPYLYSNQYVDFENAPKAVKLADQLCSGKAELEKVGAVYEYVVTNISYDKTKATSVSTGYVPVLDTVLGAQKGICFDYAALMAGMLRSQGVPARLIVGYAGTAYHAWVHVYTENQGWVTAAVFVNGKTWERMDPTYASASNQSKAIMQYIGTGSNYTGKYTY